MRTTILFLSAIALLLINSIVLSTQEQYSIGTIDKITYGNNKITLSIVEDNQTYILFTNNIVELSKGQTIKIKGTQNEYKGQKQIIITKLITTHSPASPQR